MSNYVKATNFTSKDSLPVGDPLKIVKGTEIDNEFNAIQTAVETKADLNSPAFTGTPTAPTAAAGTSSTQLATTAFVASAAGSAQPTGALLMWPTSVTPSGFLLCNGSAVSRTTYAALFAVIGTLYGAGDGSTTFNLPDFRDRFPVGAGTSYSANSKGGSKDAIVPAHSHTASTSISDPGHSHTYTMKASTGGSNAGGDAQSVGLGSYQTSSDFTGITASTTVNSTGSSATDANLPPYIGVFFIIKA